METDWWIDHGPYSEFGDLFTVRQAQFIGAGYDIENIRGVGRPFAPTMRGARPSAPMVRRKPSWLRKSRWTCWPRRWASTLRAPLQEYLSPGAHHPDRSDSGGVYCFEELFNMHAAEI